MRFAWSVVSKNVKLGGGPKKFPNSSGTSMGIVPWVKWKLCWPSLPKASHRGSMCWLVYTLSGNGAYNAVKSTHVAGLRGSMGSASFVSCLYTA